MKVHAFIEAPGGECGYMILFSPLHEAFFVGTFIENDPLKTHFLLFIPYKNHEKMKHIGQPFSAVIFSLNVISPWGIDELPCQCRPRACHPDNQVMLIISFKHNRDRLGLMTFCRAWRDDVRASLYMTLARTVAA